MKGLTAILLAFRSIGPFLWLCCLSYLKYVTKGSWPSVATRVIQYREKSGIITCFINDDSFKPRTSSCTQ